MTIGMIPPKPSVEHLPTIFRRIRLGDIRVPAFQRRFLWEADRVIQLFESIYRGYPVGSILLWKVDRQILKIAPANVTAFPPQNLSYPTHFVLDGLQRLSSLFGSCYYGEHTNDTRLEVTFDLDSERFVNPRTMGVPKHGLPLAVIFHPHRFASFQRELIQMPDGEILLNKAVDLHASLQEYMIPIVTIEGISVGNVVEIFERVNSTGVRLGTVDFMRAITWSEEFDLTQELETFQNDFDLDEFQFDDETVVKCLGLAFGLAPLPNTLLSLREKSDIQLKLELARVKLALRNVVIFIRTNLGFRSSKMVPYEGHLLLLANLFLHTDRLTDFQQDMVLRWLWATSWNEELTGKPDHYVAKIIDDLTRDILSGRKSQNQRLSISYHDIKDKRLITGRAVSTAFVGMLASRNLRSIFSDESLDAGDFLYNLKAPNIVPIFDQKELTDVLEKPLYSARIIPNVVFLSKFDRKNVVCNDLRTRIVNGWRSNLYNERNNLILQCFNEQCIEALACRNVSEFLDARSKCIILAARDSVEG